MKKSLISLAIFALAGSAWATNTSTPVAGGSASADANANAGANANANAGANASGGSAAAWGGDGGSATAIGGIGVGGTAAGGAGGAGGKGGAGGAGGKASANNSLTLQMDAQLRNPVASAIAPAAVVANGTCGIGGSIAVQTVGFAAGGSSPDVEKGCDARYDTMLLTAMGLNVVAEARICQKAEVAQAFKDAGRQCPRFGAKAEIAEEDRIASCGGYAGNDPIIMARVCKAK